MFSHWVVLYRILVCAEWVSPIGASFPDCVFEIKSEKYMSVMDPKFSNFEMYS